MPRVEIHPHNGLPMLEDTSGVMRVLARLPPHARSPFAAIGQRVALKAPNQWEEIELASWQSPHLTDQGQSSSCVGHATMTTFEVAWTQAGQPPPPAPFSGCYVYGWVNGGQDGGAVISDAAAAVKMHGVCTEQEVPEGLLFLAQFPQQAHQVAQHFRPLLVMRCTTFDEICGAIAAGFPVVSGIIVGRNFSDLDSRGLAPLPDVPLGGHALPLFELKSHPQYGWTPGGQNSWGRWGVNGTGRFYLRRQHFTNPTDAFAIVAVFNNPDNTLPVAKGSSSRSFVMASNQQQQQQAEPQHLEAAQKCGFNLDQVKGWLSQYGPQVLDDATHLVSQGFSTQWVTDTLENLGLAGPTILAVIRGWKAHSGKVGAAPVPGQEVGLFDKKTLLTILLQQVQGLLAQSLSGPALVVIQAVVSGLFQVLEQTNQVQFNQQEPAPTAT
jgi:hypothetical protein